MKHYNVEKTTGLKIIIVGCGQVGATIVEQLSNEGHDITVIDKIPERVNVLTGMYDIMGIVGNGASYSVLQEADIEKTDLVIAVTQYDELNLLCCTVAKRAGSRAAIARVGSPDYVSEIKYLRDKLDLAMVLNPEYDATKIAARLLYLPSAVELLSYHHGEVELISITVGEDSPLNGIAVRDISTITDANVLICAVDRDGEIYIPDGPFHLLQGDTVSFTGTSQACRHLLYHIGIKTSPVKNAMIVGGGKSGFYLAEQLISHGISVKIIEQDPERCAELSILLPKATVINGDGTDGDLLEEEGIRYTESFVALTGLDEENILLSLYVKKISDAKVITKINRLTFKDVINSMDLGSVFYPKYIATERIVAYVRSTVSSRKNSDILKLHHMFNNRVEAIEFSIVEESDVTNIPLKDLSMKNGMLVSFINRNGKIIIPSGNDCIKVGDMVMVVTKKTGVSEIRDILK